MVFPNGLAQLVPTRLSNLGNRAPLCRDALSILALIMSRLAALASGKPQKKTPQLTKVGQMGGSHAVGRYLPTAVEPPNTTARYERGAQTARMALCRPLAVYHNA